MSRPLSYSLLIFVLSSSFTLAQVADVESYVIGHEQASFLRNNRILLGGAEIKEAKVFKILENSSPEIVISQSTIAEIGESIAEVYDINNEVLSLRMSDHDRRGLFLSTKIGLKGWEAKAVGRFSQVPNGTIDFKYRYSLEEYFITGVGHRLTVVKKF